MPLNDILIGNDGATLNGTIHDKSFVVKSGFGEIKIPKKKITRIHFADGGEFLKDEVFLADGGHQTGTIAAKTIDFTPEGSARMDIQTKALNTIFMMGVFDDNVFGLRSFVAKSRKI